MKVLKNVVRIVRLKTNEDHEKLVEDAFDRAMAEVIKRGGAYESTHMSTIHTQEAPRVVVLLTYTETVLDSEV